ncbi:hypothetical protein LBMAG53_19900 [Planctomycetota bacterium]|nr:hypothetical protein LBMAG53_19900 [Planctomycetota bacterium]
MPMYRALSLKQPWANLIRDGHKTIETRTWATPYRGELLLCASKIPAISPFGCAVCLVELIDCQPMRTRDWAKACIAPYAPAFGWHLGNVRPVPPIPVVGTLKIFSVELPDLLILEESQVNQYQKPLVDIKQSHRR